VLFDKVVYVTIIVGKINILAISSMCREIVMFELSQAT